MAYSGDSPPKTFEDRLVFEMPRLRRYARALTRDMDAADDLVQDVMAAALRLRTHFNDKTDLRAWLFTILHNRYVSQVRRAVREGATVGVNAVTEAETLLIIRPNQVYRLELRDLDRALARLSDELREVVLLVGFEGATYSKVSRITSIPVRRVPARVAEARTALRALTD